MITKWFQNFFDRPLFFQYWILWRYGFTSWTQYLTLVTSVASLAWGSCNALQLFLHGNTKVPELKTSLLCLIPILPHSIIIVGSYSLVLSFGTTITIILGSVLFTAFFVLSALFSDDIYTFIFNIFSASFSPVLFAKKFQTIGIGLQDQENINERKRTE